MTAIVFLLEEPSAKALLQGLVPRLLGEEFHAHYLVFEGKQDLEKQIVRKLRGWLVPDSKFVVLRDQDAGDCREVKRRLTELIAESRRPALTRIACRQLESWIVGDMRAVSEAFSDSRLAAHAKKAKFRDPDRLQDPASELRRLIPDYGKIDGARRVGLLMDSESNASHSFREFCRGLRRHSELA